MKIYLDMDGVLTNFDAKFDSLFGKRPTSGESRKKHFWDNWIAFIEGNHFQDLEMLDGAEMLLKEVRDLRVPVEILSSSGGASHHEKVKARSTRHWLFHPR